MAKKSAGAEFNMSQMIRELLTANPKLTSQEAAEAILAKYPNTKINKNSFAVAFYTGRQKLGIRFSRRGGKVSRVTKLGAGRSKIDLAMLQATARFLRDVGGADAAIEAIKQVQAVQVR